jgi:hypothetical protein
MYAWLYWKDSNGFQHVMRGPIAELESHMDALTEAGLPWEVDEF